MGRYRIIYEELITVPCFPCIQTAALATFVILCLLLTLGCTRDAKVPKLIVAAPAEVKEAKVFIDGQFIANLQRERLTSRLMKKLIPHPDFFPGELLSASVDVSGLSEGSHEVRLVSRGRELISRKFHSPLTEDLLVLVELKE